jgi:UDP-3-O-[3-hydroxymyristoyl] N-acetylglucosamine deacetylase
MSILYQQTIAEKVSCTGIGLHSGAPAQLTLYPARANSGVVFVRTDRATPVEIPARSSEVSSTALATTLGRGDASIGTVEHLMSALYGLGIDNVRIEVDGPELPVMDGSAAPFVYLLRSAGLFAQRERRRVLRVRRRIEIQDGDRAISIEPARDFRVSYAVDFEHPAIRRQQLTIAPLDAERFEREISAARTFGFLQEVRALWDAGFARGGSLDNTVVLDEEKVVNPEGLRWPDEFVRHKVLDLFGDLALLGMPIQGHVRAERGGHSLHQQLLAAMLAQPDAWTVVDPERSAGRGLSLSRLTAARA